MKLSIKYNLTTYDRVEDINLCSITTLDMDNEFIDFDFLPFTLKEFSETKIHLRLIPKQQGSFELESLSFSILDIPKKFNFNTSQNNNRNYNSNLTSIESIRKCGSSQYERHFP